MGGKAKGTMPSKKTQAKAKEKIVQDKTFGLKNKNKSVKVQKQYQPTKRSIRYIKSVSDQVFQKKGSQQARIAAQYQAKQQKKKAMAANALLSSLYKDLNSKKSKGKIYKIIQNKLDTGKNQQDSDEEQRESVAVVNDKIDYYNDPRVARGDVALHCLSKITCKYFLKAIQNSQYGFRWTCPNKGDQCPYRHFLPEGYILQKDMKILQQILKAQSKQELPIEERIEQKRAELPSQGLTPVTKQTFMAWKQKKQKQRAALAKHAAALDSKSLKHLSGKALFNFDPSLFIDDDNATEEYEEEQRKGQDDADNELNQQNNEQHKIEEKDKQQEAQVTKSVEDTNESSKQAENSNIPIDQELFLEENLDNIDID